ncbi:hypothetical protein [Arabiibacter massiliensis]|uniref:hypothetical protein n=1 Tax=Arabiibacter massiliensis TaxID=1870985 RepID=UPI00117AD984|nr:hypothetical protein [Arabiibacter massiliensis]
MGVPRFVGWLAKLQEWLQARAQRVLKLAPSTSRNARCGCGEEDVVLACHASILGERMAIAKLFYSSAFQMQSGFRGKLHPVSEDE